MTARLTVDPTRFLLISLSKSPAWLGQPSRARRHRRRQLSAMPLPPPPAPPLLYSFHGLAVEIMIMALTGSWQEARVRVFLTWLLLLALAATAFIVVYVSTDDRQRDGRMDGRTHNVGSLGATYASLPPLPSAPPLKLHRRLRRFSF